MSARGFIEKSSQASDSIAAHFAAAAVGVVHLHPHVCISSWTQHDKPIATYAEPAIGNAPGKTGGIGRTNAIGNDINVIVAASMHLDER
jgi:hypothetical protein